MKELSYSKNTFFMILAAAFSQVSGAVMKIFLSYRLKETGMAIYQVALSVYSLFLTPVLCGIPIAATRFVSKRRAQNPEGEISDGISFIFYTMLFLGAVCGFMMLLTRRFFAVALKEPCAEYAILVLSPSILFVALGAVAKSCFEGFSNMLPCAVSQGAESVLKLIFTFIFTCICGIFTLKYAVAGAALSLTLGEAAATILLFLLLPSFKISRQFSKNRDIYYEILSYALPVSVYAIVLSSLNLLENSVIRNGLASVKFSGFAAKKLIFEYSEFTSAFDTVKETGKLSAEGAAWLYGAYFGYALTVIRFPAGLLRMFCVPFFPLAAKHFAGKTLEKLRILLFRIIKTMLFISLPMSVFFMLFAPQITGIVFGSPAYSHMLIFAAPLLVFAPLCELLSTLWYAGGKAFPPFLFALISSMLSIVLSAILIRIPSLNISGVAVSSVISVFAELVMLAVFTKRHLK